MHLGINIMDMRTSFLSFLLFVSLVSVQAQHEWTDKSRVLPDNLRRLPVGLTLWHNPNPVYPVLEGEVYVWRHSTSIRAEVADLEVVECGSYIWYAPAGWQANMLLSKRDFIKRFNCRKGILQQGQAYTWPENNRYGKQAYGGDSLWYIIAQDSTGKRYKGIGIVETEGTP